MYIYLNLYGPFLWMGFTTASRLKIHCEETLYFLPPCFQKYMVICSSTLGWWQPESTFEPPSVLNMEPLDWQSIALTTGPLFNKKILKCASNGTI